LGQNGYTLKELDAITAREHKGREWLRQALSLTFEAVPGLAHLKAFVQEYLGAMNVSNKITFNCLVILVYYKLTGNIK